VLSPELSARLGRIAAAEGRAVASVLADAVLLFWTRWALERRVPPGDW
jgi:hypothetical protein